MKTKLALLLAVGIFAGLASSQAGGGRGGIFINPGGGYCPPVRPVYSAPFCAAPAYRCYPGNCYYPFPAFYSWGPSVVVYSGASSDGFSNVSPILNYAGGAPVYQIPPPVIPAPIALNPGSPFRWQH